MTHDTDPAAFAKAALAFIPVGLRILAVRALTFGAFAGALGLFVAAICIGSLMALGIAAGYAVLVFLPVLVRDGRGAAAP